MAFPGLIPEGRSVEPLPANTRLPNVLGTQPPTFARGREVAALLLWSLAVFLSLALLSYAGDPQSPQEGAEALRSPDWVGPVGAASARAFVTMVGVAAWVVPLEAILLGIPFVRGKTSNATAARLAGDILMVVIAAALVQVGWPGELAFGRHPAGGMVGELFGELARSLFSTAGSFLVGFSLLGLILIGRASFSFIALMRWFARLGRASAAKSASGARSVADAWVRARELERERKLQEAREAEPRIAVSTGEEATILAADDPLDAEAEDSADREPSPPVRVRVASDSFLPSAGEAATSTPFPETSPLVVVSDKKRGRRKKVEIEPSRGEPGEEATVAETLALRDDASEQVAEAADIGVDESAPSADEARPPRRSRSKKTGSDITIVDTSAALEKDAPAKDEVKRDRDKEKRSQGPSFRLPSPDMLSPAEVSIGPTFDEAKLRANAELLVKTLADYKVTGKVEEILPGPVVTTFEVSPVAGTKVSKVAALADDLALALAKKVRIVAPIPGKNRIGFELPNDRRVAVNFRDLVEDRRFQTLDVPLPVVLGRDIVGNPVYADLASMPHAIVAGATGAGKSVGLNVMLTSLLYRRTPEELRLLMIDPKVVELAPYDRIPHMLLPVVTDMKQAATALKWAVDEMERRYQLFADAGTKNIGTYNAWVKRVHAGEARNPLGKAIVGRDLNGIQEVLRVRDDDPEGEQQMPEALPMIVIVVDEFADLMMQQGKEVEAAVARLAQKARAAGMHVILATQRPSVDVITGMIKANFPTRIAYRVAQKIDSRTILDEQGAEHLLGRGDMLIKLNGTNETRRVQCPWVSEEEVQAVTDFLRAQGEPVYDENILKPRDDEASEAEDDDGETDPMYDDAVRIVAETRRCSTSWLQRKLGLGYNRAARIVETMERRGLVGPANGSKDREVLIDAI